MPSAKPDKQEIDDLRRRRGLLYAGPAIDQYSDLHAQCESAVSGGYISLDRARGLLQYLHEHATVAAIYPNNVLANILARACADAGWSTSVERDLLHLLFSLYLGYEIDRLATRPTGFQISLGADGVIHSGTVEERPQICPPGDISLFLSDADTRRSPNLQPLLTEFFDEPHVLPSLHEKFIGFTGTFTFGSRAACFAEVRRRSGVPCSPAPYMDYMFVSREHEQQGAMSSQAVSAIYFRRFYGTPLVLRERVWESLTNAG